MHYANNCYSTLQNIGRYKGEKWVIFKYNTGYGKKRCEMRAEDDLCLALCSHVWIVCEMCY